MRRSPRWLIALLLGASFAAADGCSSESIHSRATDATSESGGTGGATASISSTTSVVATTGTAGGDLPATFTVAGVVTDGASPIEGAIVMQGGGEPAMTTGPDGAYSIELTQAIPGTPTVVAAKVGWRSAGLEIIELPNGPVDLVLRAALPPDNTA